MIKDCINNYNYQVSQEEQRFRDLFGKEELEQARKQYFSNRKQSETYLEFLKCETERKLENA